MKFLAHIHAFWQHRSLRQQLTIVIATVGLFALLLNGILLGAFLKNYFLERQGLLMAQQAKALAQCCMEDNTLLYASPQTISHFTQIAFANTPARRIVIITNRGNLRYATPMSQTLLQTLLTRERRELSNTPSPSPSATPQWNLVGDQLIVIVPISSLATLKAPAQQRIVGVVLLDEDQKTVLQQWNNTLALITLSAGAAVILILLGGILAARVLARPLGDVTAVVQDISGGNYARRVTPRGPAEIYTLGVSFNRMIDKVQDQQRIEHDLLANISHELASPLGLIRGYVEALLDNIIDDDAQRLIALRAISVETTRLARLSGDLLDLALLDTGQIVVHYEFVPVHELLAGLYERFTHLAARADVHLELEISAQLPHLQTDGLRLEQVVVNLLNNALQHTPPQGTISIAASEVEKQLQLKVSDTGQGIPPEKLSHIWERFYQVDGARDRRRGAAGVGLGLAICRSIIIQLNGYMTVTSSVGQGTTFTIYLPY